MNNIFIYESALSKAADYIKNNKGKIALGLAGAAALGYGADKLAHHYTDPKMNDVKHNIDDVNSKMVDLHGKHVTKEIQLNNKETYDEVKKSYCGSMSDADCHKLYDEAAKKYLEQDHAQMKKLEAEAHNLKDKKHNLERINVVSPILGTVGGLVGGALLGHHLIDKNKTKDKSKNKKD